MGGEGKQDKKEGNGRWDATSPGEERKANRDFKISKTMAFRCWREGAILGDCEAMYLLAMMYLEGSKVEQSDRKAFVWLRRAALQGHVDAAVLAGHLCCVGRGVTARNETRALNYMLFAADHDSPQGLLHAARLLLLRYERDPQDPAAAPDRAQAVEFLQRAVAKGNREAFFVLARELSDGTSSERREGQALLLGAAEKGDVHAMFHCALWFLDGSWASAREVEEETEEERCDAGVGREKGGAAQASGHFKLGMEWLARAAKGSHPLAIPLHSMFVLHESHARAIPIDTAGGQASHQVDSFDPGDLQAYLSAGHFLDMDQETKLAADAAAAANGSSPAMPFQRALAAELLEPKYPAAAAPQACPGGGSIADRLAVLRSSFQTVLQVTEQELQSRLAAEKGFKTLGHGTGKKRNVERGFGGSGVPSLLAGKQMLQIDLAKARGLLGIPNQDPARRDLKSV